MYLFDNAVLQRGLSANLRMARGFLLLLLYNGLLGFVVVIGWPPDDRLDLTANPEAAKRLVDLFFLGQYILASLMTPSFAAGTITFEKEYKTYEMLLATPMKPAAIVLGKLLSSLTHLAILIFASLPIVMLCLPLGGVSMYEVLAAYLGLVISVITFGMISISCSSYFRRTASALVVSYLMVLPLALAAVFFWRLFAGDGFFRLILTLTLMPTVCGMMCAALFFNTCRRLLHPPDVGSEGKEVVDIEEEAENAVGLVIQRDQFPDRLFAPAKRTDLLDDKANPVYDKEIRSEIFSQGTLMLRLVIQISMFLAIPLMAIFLYIWPHYAAWYIGYIIIFNMLVGPVFSAGAITSERERETLDLLLTTTISPWQILWGKLVAGLRVSSVLTMFLVWPVLLACLMVTSYWSNLLGVAAFLSIVLMTCLTTAMLALFNSVVFRKTAHSMMATYITIIILFCLPPAAAVIASTLDLSGAETTALFGMISPFSTAFEVPLYMDLVDETLTTGRWFYFFGYMLFGTASNLGLLVTMIWLFNSRWRVAR
ncbi:MAG: ABC transporter permease [Pirellulaceae bacterium]|nr:ABC transporter permease [Pirellulaceae bacterium]